MDDRASRMLSGTLLSIDILEQLLGDSGKLWEDTGFTVGQA